MRCCRASRARPRRSSPSRRAAACATTTSSSQERIVRGRMPTMEIINERFARNIRVGLFNLIRKSAEISIGGDARCRSTAPSCARSWCRPTSTSSRCGRCAAAAWSSASRTLVFAVVDALFGGHGKFRTRIEGRDFSPTEQRIIRRLVDVVIAGYAQAWNGIYPLELEYQRSEMQPQFANVATPSEVIVSTSFMLEIGETSGSIHFCIPYSTLEPIRDVLYSTVQGDGSEPDRRWLTLMTDADPGGRGRARRRARACAGDGRAAARVQAGRLHRARPEARRSRPSRRRAGARLPLRHLERQVRA